MSEAVLGIGALERLSGIPAATLRTWERRYGFPTAARSEGGHRSYDLGTVERLQMIAAALAAGHRAAAAVPAEVPALRRLLGQDAARAPVTVETDLPRLVRNEDHEGLERALAAGLAARGAERWVREMVGPLLATIGDLWAAGEIDVAAEHRAAEVVRAQLRQAWRALEPRHGRLALLCTLPGERHDLGLHMAAVILAMAGWRITFLGADTPTDDTVRAGTNADAVVLSFAAGSKANAADLARIVAALPGKVVVGGAGAPDVAGALRPQGLEGLMSWASGV